MRVFRMRGEEKVVQQHGAALTPLVRRLYEKAMHIFFRDVRVHKRKEFFAVSEEEIVAFFDMIEGKCQHEDHHQWLFALDLAARYFGHANT